MSRRALAVLSLICLISLSLPSCLVRRRLIVRTGGNVKQKLIVADRSTLLNAIVRQYETIHDFSATVDMVPALGSVEKSQITEYKDVRAFILFRKPDGPASSIQNTCSKSCSIPWTSASSCGRGAIRVTSATFRQAEVKPRRRTRWPQSIGAGTISVTKSSFSRAIELASSEW